MEHARLTRSLPQLLRRISASPPQWTRAPQCISPILRREYKPRGSTAVPDAIVPQFKDGIPMINERIPAGLIHLVNENKLLPPVPLKDVLGSFDHSKDFLAMMSRPEQEGLPICKILNRTFESGRLREQKKASKSQSNSKAGPEPKQLELNWAIAPHDFEHRLGKLEQFLKKGLNVELVLMRKRKGKKATVEEGQAMVERINQRVKEVEGADTWRPMEGAIKGPALGELRLYFKGKSGGSEKVDENVEELSLKSS